MDLSPFKSYIDINEACMRPIRTAQDQLELLDNFIISLKHILVRIPKIHRPKLDEFDKAAPSDEAKVERNTRLLARLLQRMKLVAVKMRSYTMRMTWIDCEHTAPHPKAKEAALLQKHARIAVAQNLMAAVDQLKKRLVKLDGEWRDRHA